MFIALEIYRKWMPRWAEREHERFYLAVLLSTEAPWFLLSHRVPDEPEALIQSVVVAQDDTLVHLVELLGEANVVSVHRVSKHSRGSAEWSMQRVEEVWIAADAETRPPHQLLYRLRGETSLKNASGATVPGLAASAGSLLLKLKT